MHNAGVGRFVHPIASSSPPTLFSASVLYHTLEFMLNQEGSEKYAKTTRQAGGADRLLPLRKEQKGNRIL